MKIAWVTSIFLGARNDRPHEYYLRPLSQIVPLVLESKFSPVVFTWERYLEKVRQIVPEELIHIGNPSQMCLSVMPDYRWRMLGTRLHAHPDDIMCRDSNLLAVYFSRCEMMRLALKYMNADAALWFDCGWVNSVLKQCDDSIFHDWDLQNAHNKLEGMMNENPLILCRINGMKEAIRPFISVFGLIEEWYIAGGIWCAAARGILPFIDMMAQAWRIMLKKGTLQDDECAMTLAAWEHNIPALNQNDWYNIIRSS